MNSQEKIALARFISLYTLSSIILVAIIAYLYYNKEIEGQKRACKVDLQNSFVQVESKLLKAKLYEEDFIFDADAYHLGIGLFDKDKKPLYSSLCHEDVNFSQMMTKAPSHIHFIKALSPPLLNVHYIVTEDTSMPIGKEKLLSLIFLVIFCAFIFIAVIGYLLSKLLLKPVKEKIKQIDKFIKDSAHEINTPIASLLMSVSALKKKGMADTKILNHISNSSKQIADVYNSLSHLAFDDIKHPHALTPSDFQEQVHKSIEFYTQIAKSKAIMIESHLEACHILIDPDDAKKLINNLLSNAVKYNKPKGKIIVTLKNNHLHVQDEGIGLDEKQKKVILKRYHRESDLQGGFGIGLDIVNSICTRYGIRLHIRSKKGEGSIFSVDFSPIALKT